MPIDIGPVQLLVFGFDRPKFGGGIAAELTRLKELDMVRIIDALVVHKDAAGNVRKMQITDLEPEQAEGFGAILGSLVGLGAEGEQGIEAGAAAGAQTVEDRGGHLFDPEQWDVLDDIPADSAAAMVLLEHRWAIPFRDAVVAEGGIAVGDMWLHPSDLVAVGLIGAEMAEEAQRRAA